MRGWFSSVMDRTNGVPGLTDETNILLDKSNNSKKSSSNYTKRKPNWKKNGSSVENTSNSSFSLPTNSKL